MKVYSANDEFKKLCHNLGFKFVIFDDPSFKDVKIRDSNKNQEIDAFIYEKNIVCAVGINRGVNDQVETSMNNFFQRLDRRHSYTDLDLQTYGSEKDNNAVKKANAALQELKKHFKKYQKPYKEIFVKIFFCPHRVVSEREFELRQNTNDEIIIDKDIFDYLMAVALRLPRINLVNDFYYLLRVKKTDLSKLVSGRPKKPNQINPYPADKLEIDKNLTIFNLCPIVEDIYQLSTVRRIANKYDKRGFQRMIKATRLDRINKDYLSKNKTFPNNIIMALNPEFYKDEKDFFDIHSHFKFYDEFNSLFLIDGQHRFYSFVKGDKLDRQIIVSLIFFKHKKDDAKYLQMDQMFYEINKKSEKIDPNLAFSLLAKIDSDSEENFWHTVFTKLLVRSSLFKNRFTFKESTIKESNKKSIISVIQYGGTLKLNRSILKRGINVPGLDVYYTSKSRRQKIEFAATLIQNYFEIIEKILHEQKVKKDLLGPRDIGAFLRMLYHFNISASNEIRVLGETKKALRATSATDINAVNTIYQRLNSIGFKELIGLDLAPSNWAAVEGYLLKVINEKKDPSFGNKNILSKKGLEIYND